MKKKKQTEDSNLTITEMAIVATMETQNVSLMQEIKSLKNILQEKEDEINHLKELLKNGPSKLIVDDEETIATLQLERLKNTAMERELTLEEVKKFDLLVKNKRLSNGKSTMNADYVKLPSDQPKDLMAIATLRTTEENGENS